MAASLYKLATLKKPERIIDQQHYMLRVPEKPFAFVYTIQRIHRKKEGQRSTIVSESDHCKKVIQRFRVFLRALLLVNFEFRGLFLVKVF